MTDIEITAAPQPRIVVRKRFQCVFCSFSRATRQLVVEHIARCWADPAAKTCRTCIHFERGFARTVYVEGGSYIEDSPDACALGEPLPERAPVVDCPLWRDRDDEEEESAP